jgi:hypothetical protein
LNASELKEYTVYSIMLEQSLSVTSKRTAARINVTGNSPWDVISMGPGNLKAGAETAAPTCS